MGRNLQCVKLGCEAEGLDMPPLPGELGKRIYDSVSKEAWQQWLRVQTMLINEKRLNLSQPSDRQFLVEQADRHFFGGGNLGNHDRNCSSGRASGPWTRSGLE
jgi:Fe-S cluster biosynthesis and repair protein YggX